MGEFLIPRDCSPQRTSRCDSQHLSTSQIMIVQMKRRLRIVGGGLWARVGGAEATRARPQGATPRPRPPRPECRDPGDRRDPRYAAAPPAAPGALALSGCGEGRGCRSSPRRTTHKRRKARLSETETNTHTCTFIA